MVVGSACRLGLGYHKSEPPARMADHVRGHASWLHSVITTNKGPFWRASWANGNSRLSTRQNPRPKLRRFRQVCAAFPMFAMQTSGRTFHIRDQLVESRSLRRLRAGRSRGPSTLGARPKVLRGRRQPIRTGAFRK